MAKKGKGRMRELAKPHHLKGKGEAPKPVRKPLPVGPYAPSTVTPIGRSPGDGAAEKE